MIMSNMNWVISDEYGVWLIENKSGVDAFSINFCQLLDVTKFESEFANFTYSSLKVFVETQWRVDKSYFDKFIIR